MRVFAVIILLLVAAGVCALSAGASTNIPSAQAAVSIKDPLVIDAYDKTNYAHEGDVASLFTFSIRNDSADGIVIDDMKTSCGCTVAAMPSKPWYVKPGESNLFKVLIDIREKTGILRKDVWVESSNYSRALALTVDILPSAGTNDVNPKLQLRLFGQQLAAVDRTQIFTQDECLHCHLVPAFGKSGEQLFHVACGICHESKHRATMVPDLSALKTEIDPDYWRRWVTHGKPGTLMPGFDSRERGPLDDADIDGLVKYLTTAFPRPVKTSAPQK